MPRNPHKTRCTAHTATGARCANWSMKGKTVCMVHSGHSRPARHDPRRCTARTAAGRRCNRWAMRHTRDHQRPLCRAHAIPRRDSLATQGPPGDRCTAHTTTGARCSLWAQPGSRARFGRPLCFVHIRIHHTGYNHPPPPPAQRRCTATTLQGHRCTHWTFPGAQARNGRPLCWTHAHPQQHPALRHGYYGRIANFGPQVQLLIHTLQANGHPRQAQIAEQRIKLGGILAYVSENQPTPHQWSNLTRLIRLGLRAIARLTHEQTNPPEG